MVNINLSTSQSSQYNSQNSVIFQRGMIVVAIILVLVAIVTGGLLVWTNSLNNKIAVSESSYQTKLTGLMANPRNKDIIDFQDRLSASNDLVAQTNVPVDALSEIEKTLVAGVYLTSYTVDAAAKTLSLECVADSYASVAKQALSFKSSKYFSEVNVKKASLSDGGKDIFSVDIKLN